MLLSITNLDFAYGEAQILYGITLDVPVGKITCIMGRNGVGKTTLLRNIMGTLTPNAGRMLLAGKDLLAVTPPKRGAGYWSSASGVALGVGFVLRHTGHSAWGLCAAGVVAGASAWFARRPRSAFVTPAHERAKLGISLVPQGRDIFPKLTVEENLRIGLEARTDGVKKIPPEIFDLFPVLHDMRRRMGGDLSGGQQQQLAIGRALAGNPGLLLLDEPTEGIQPSIIKQIGAVLKRLSERGDMAIVLVEQYFDFVREFGDSFVIMNRGRIVHRGHTSELDQSVIKQHLSV
jgi:urea transport system ATP-binding protein